LLVQLHHEPLQLPRGVRRPVDLTLLDECGLSFHSDHILSKILRHVSTDVLDFGEAFPLEMDRGYHVRSLPSAVSLRNWSIRKLVQFLLKILVASGEHRH